MFTQDALDETMTMCTDVETVKQSHVSVSSIPATVAMAAKWK